MNNILFKDLTAGSPIYALIKADDELQFSFTVKFRSNNKTKTSELIFA